MPPYVTSNAYDTKERSFKRTVLVLPLSDIPNGANVISRHKIYKVKIEADHLLRIKARIAPLGNKQ